MACVTAYECEEELGSEQPEQWGDPDDRRNDCPSGRQTPCWSRGLCSTLSVSNNALTPATPSLGLSRAWCDQHGGSSTYFLPHLLSCQGSCPAACAPRLVHCGSCLTARALRLIHHGSSTVARAPRLMPCSSSIVARPLRPVCLGMFCGEAVLHPVPPLLFLFE